LGDIARARGKAHPGQWEDLALAGGIVIHPPVRRWMHTPSDDERVLRTAEVKVR
jgi:hypothetical protein